MLKIGEEIELRVDKFAEVGKCLSRINGFVVFIEGVIPGELVKVRICKAKRKYAEARLISVLEKSPFRIEPRCNHFGICGGCKWQHLDYQHQLEVKRLTVSDAITNIGGFKDIEVPPPISSPNIYGYRTKMEFSFSDRCWLSEKDYLTGRQIKSQLALGLHAPHQYSSVVDITNCHLQRSPSSEILKLVKDIAINNDWQPWNCIKKQGYLKNLIIKTAERTEDIMVNLITSTYNPDRMKIFKELIQMQLPEVTTLVNTILPKNTQNALNADIEVIYGNGVIYDCIGNYRFRVEPNSFFQPNTSQAEVLYNLARSFGNLKPTDILYDLYCGAGTISIFLSSFVKRVIGVDLDIYAIKSANYNKALNNVNNCSFFCGDVMKTITGEFIQEHGKPDILIVDPPRVGLHNKLVEFIAKLKPPLFIYISCNPMTQMRDIALLRDFYTIEAVQPVDMFPQTYHVESIVKLRLIN